MKKALLILVAAVLVLCLCVGCSASGEVTWAHYQNWLIESFADKSPTPDSFKELVLSFENWEEIDTTLEPWNKFFGEGTFDASTWDEFVAAGGEGSFNADFEDNYEASGEPTGEPSGEPAVG